MDTAKRQPQDDMWDDKPKRVRIKLGGKKKRLTMLPVIEMDYVDSKVAETINDNLFELFGDENQPVKSVREDELRRKVIAVLEHKTLDEDAAFELIDGYYRNHYQGRGDL